MKFDIILSGERQDAVIELIDTETHTGCTIFGFGAILNSFKVFGSNGTQKNVIDGFNSLQDAKINIMNGFKSAKLSPFVCRLNNGDFTFEGADHHIDKFYLGKEAIHGLLFDAPFMMSSFERSDKEAAVFLTYDYHKLKEGFPYPFQASIHYSLRAGNALRIQTSITNTGISNMPVSDGWHPYFTLGPIVNEVFLQINSNTMVEFDTQLLPTGNLIAYDTFEKSQKIGETFLDNCFVLKDTEKPCCTLRDEQAGLELTITADSQYPYLQIYTPEHRKSIALENLSSAPDAFNNKMGLRILRPSESAVFTTTYTIRNL